VSGALLPAWRASVGGGLLILVSVQFVLRWTRPLAPSREDWFARFAGTMMVLVDAAQQPSGPIHSRARRAAIAMMGQRNPLW
jgi:hypothetical protein